MKRLSRIAICLIVLTTANQSGFSTLVLKKDVQGLADLKVENVSVKRSNVVLALSDFAARYNVPIGVEVSPDDDLLQERTISVQMDNGTVKEVLNSIVKQNPLYTWDGEEGVINVYPKSNRALSLKAVLETKISTLRIAEKTARFTFREAVTNTEEVKSTLAAFGIQSNNEVFSSSDVRLLGRGFSLSISNATVKSIFNRVIRDSDTRFWIINLDGPNREYLLLNF